MWFPDCANPSKSPARAAASRALAEFSGYFNSGYPAVPGVGALALRVETEGVAELPLVTVLVHKGDAVIELALRPVAETADGTVLAPGTVDEQVDMAVKLANLLLPRLFGAA